MKIEYQGKEGEPLPEGFPEEFLEKFTLTILDSLPEKNFITGDRIHQGEDGEFIEEPNSIVLIEVRGQKYWMSKKVDTLNLGIGYGLATPYLVISKHSGTFKTLEEAKNFVRENEEEK